MGEHWFEIEDDSMADPKGSPSSFYPGDKVLIDTQIKPQAGHAVLVWRSTGELLVRTLSPPDLVPLNPDYPTQSLAAGDDVVVVVAIHRRARITPI